MSAPTLVVRAPGVHGTGLRAVVGLMAAAFLAAVGLVAAPAPEASAASAAQLRASAVKIAAQQAGKPYRAGAAGPSAFDCSGLTTYVWKTKLKRTLPRTADAQYRATKKISQSAAVPGDLVFFLSGGRAYHVGIYAGSGQMWHSSKPGKPVAKVKIWTSSWKAGRVV